MVFQWSLYVQVSSIPQDSSLYSGRFQQCCSFNFPLIYMSSSPYTNPLVIVQSTPIIIDINVTFMFHIFSSSQARSTYLFLFSFSFSFTCCQPEQQSLRLGESSFSFCLFFFFFFFLLTVAMSGHLAQIRQSISTSKSRRSLCVSFSGWILGCAYTIGS